MVVQHNLQAMNSNRMLGITQGTLAKSTEKLSSGYKVNRAADDAAGLSISEKMRKQIRGLTQASLNAEDGISSVQTAEGALTEVHDMLQRMNELAVKAANGTNSENDRQTIQDEIDQLTTEIDRVAETTKFNEIYLLKGDGTKGTKTLEAHDAGLKGKLVNNGNGKSTFTADEISVGSKVSIGGTEYNIVDSVRADEYKSINSATFSKGGVIVQDGIEYTVKTESADKKFEDTIFVDKDGNEVEFALKDNAVYTTTLGKSYTLVGKDGLELENTASANDAATMNGDPDNAIDPLWKNGDTIVDADGVEYTYVEANGTLNNITYTDAGFYKSEGNKADDEAYVAKAGDKYTIKETGETDRLSDKGIATVKTIQNAIKNLVDTDTVTIKDSANDPGKTYVVGVTTKEDGTTYTADDIAALVKEGQYVSLAADAGTNKGDYYALPSESDSKTDISLKVAYEKMAEELKAASDVGADEGTLSSVKNNGDGTFEITHGKVEVDNGLSFNLHVGADADLTNKIGVSIDTMSSAGLGVKNLNVKDDSGKAATYAIDAIEDAVKKVSAQRSLLGAVQNRLEHTIKNLDNIVENTTAAESTIRDTDMAEEMVKYSNNNILAQAGQSMLAQANQSNQGVLSLLG